MSTEETPGAPDVELQPPTDMDEGATAQPEQTRTEAAEGEHEQVTAESEGANEQEGEGGGEQSEGAGAADVATEDAGEERRTNKKRTCLLM